VSAPSSRSETSARILEAIEMCPYLATKAEECCSYFEIVCKTSWRHISTIFKLEMYDVDISQLRGAKDKVTFHYFLH
jgi:hypothetical protein